MSEANQNVPAEPQRDAPKDGNVRKLADAIREVKNAMADRDDVVVEIREVTRTRLEMLATELEPVIADAGAEHPGFDFAISSGQQPRYWIDAVAHVSLGRDRRTYRFVRDTRNGRVLLAEATDVRAVADAVTRYVAERIVERQRDLESEPRSSTVEAEEASTAGAETPAQPHVVRTAEVPKPDRAQEFMSTVALVLLGIILGAAATILILRERVPEIQNLF
jgi:hypothetical protein